MGHMRSHMPAWIIWIIGPLGIAQSYAWITGNVSKLLLRTTYLCVNGVTHLKLSGQDDLGGVDDGARRGARRKMVQLVSQKRPVLLGGVWPVQ